MMLPAALKALKAVNSKSASWIKRVCIVFDLGMFKQNSKNDSYTAFMTFGGCPGFIIS